jgi:hypothetical protein
MLGGLRIYRTYRYKVVFVVFRVRLLKLYTVNVQFVWD